MGECQTFLFLNLGIAKSRVNPQKTLFQNLERFQFLISNNKLHFSWPIYNIIAPFFSWNITGKAGFGKAKTKGRFWQSPNAVLD
jgi:hypothetical protein